MSQKDQKPSPVDTVLRIVVLANLMLIASSCTTWFSGTAQTPGIADRTLEHLRLGGWRADIAWLLLSNILLFFAFLYSLVEIRHPAARLNIGFLLLALIAFYFYVHHLLHSGLLYMG